MGIKHRVSGWIRSLADLVDGGSEPSEEDCPRPEQVINALLLTDLTEVDDHVVYGWSRQQLDEAYEWAIRDHCSASDNEDCERVPCPPHVEALRRVR